MRYSTPEIDQICTISQPFCTHDERFPILIGYLHIRSRDLLGLVYKIAIRLERPFREGRHSDVVESLYDLVDICSDAVAQGRLILDCDQHPARTGKVDRSWAHWQTTKMHEFSRMKMLSPWRSDVSSYESSCQ